MNSTQSTFLSGAIFGAALGLICGHFTIWQYTNAEPSSIQATSELPEGYVLDSPYFPGGAEFELGERSASLPPEYYSFDERDSGEASIESPVFENAIAFETEEVVKENTPQQVAELDIAVKQIPLDAFDGDEPQPLSIPEAQSLKEHTAKTEEEIRALIDRELPDAPASQKEVWFDSLKDLGSDDVTGVLKMWKMFGGPTASMNSLEELHPPGSENDGSMSGDRKKLIKQAIAWHQHNLLMASTPGYKRIVPIFVEKKIDGEMQVAKLTRSRSFEQGQVVVTQHPFHLFIHGAGLFKLQSTDGDVVYTKRGDFTINQAQRLSLIINDVEYVLLPEETLSDDLKELLETDGTLEARGGVIMDLQVISDNKLTPIGNGLFTADESARPLSFVGSLEQGGYESSNVDVEAETQAITQLQKMLEAM